MRNQRPVSRAGEFVAAKRRRQIWTKAVGVLACVVVFCTTYALILPAITLESGAHCGYVEHQHTDECYTQQLICGIEAQEEQEGQESVQGHVHTGECYGEVETLVCDQPESGGHTHTETCYDAEGALTCGQEESEGHTHTAECYAVESVLTCGQEEGQPEAAQPHVHTEACYGPVLTCELEEHTHTDACYVDVTADLETAADWEATLPAELTGVWTDDLIAVAESQLGYTESTVNYTLTEDGSHKGYTRYGAWYGMPYEDWCAMFASFCLNYAGIPAESMPRASACQSWIDTLSSESWNLYVAVERQEGSSDSTEDSYLPDPGNLVFFDFNGDGASDHVGIVAEYNEATLMKGAELKTIEGNSSSKVQYVTYDPADPAIMGYAMLPENLTTLTYAGEDYTVAVAYGLDAELPENVELSAAEYAKDSETYLARYAEAAALYGWTEDKTDSIRLFDVGLYVDGQEVEPAAPVRVTITYTGADGRGIDQVTHFGRQETETVDAASTYADGQPSTEFSLNSFSDIMLLSVETLTGASLTGHTFALVNPANNMIMTATADGNYLAGASYVNDETNTNTSVIFTQKNGYFYTARIKNDGSPLSVDEFNNSYVVWSVVQGTGNNNRNYYLCANDTQYLSISNNGSLTLVNNMNEASAVTFTSNNGNTMVRITDNNSYAINQYGGKTYFGSWPGGGSSNEYFYLVDAVEEATVTTVDGMVPKGTVINVFDYWARNNGPLYDGYGELIGGDYTWSYPEGKDATNYTIEGDNRLLGINTDHSLKFTRHGSLDLDVEINKGGFRQGIVEKTLVDGYPYLAANTGVTPESLSYLFDPDAQTDYRNVYRNTQGLLQSIDGYYVYDSTQNYAELDTSTNEFTLYSVPGVYGAGSFGQFFPFDSFEKAEFASAISDELNHYFGMTLTARFIQRYGGHTTSARDEDMIFEFSGDDDVWIFIDDVLVADLGGIRSAASVSINFSTGAVTITYGNMDYSTTLSAAFGAANKEPSGGWADADGNRIFADNTYHTLKFYYLERGNSASNLKLKYNLSDYPVTGITKVNQNGAAVAGAEFKVYKANDDYSIIGDTAVYTGTTDANGEMIFADKDGVAYTMAELYNMFGEYFVLKETGVPAGYRVVSDEIHMRIINQKVMVCENTPQSGVYASANLKVAAPNTIMLVNGDAREIVTETAGQAALKGRVFAVVLQYVGPRDVNGNATELNKQSSWLPVYGTDESGFQTMPVSAPNDSAAFITAAIDAAKLYRESQNVFALEGSGSVEGTLVGMPGDITKYYYMLDANSKGQTEYTIAYYYTEADSLEDANSKNTTRINADVYEQGGTTTSQYAFDRLFGAEIEVPNLVNRLIVQKTDDEGNLVNGATFALYSAGEDTDSYMYYIATDGTHLYLDDDGNAFTGGPAADLGGTLAGTYSVDETTGAITVTGANGKTAYTVTPLDVQTTAYNQAAGEAGSAIFGLTKDDNGNLTVGKALEQGTYCVREIKAPDGYAINTVPAKVLVNATGIYANAGTADDGITVLRGPGYLVSNLSKFAYEGKNDTDNSLTWIVEMMRISGADANGNTFAKLIGSLDDKDDVDWDYISTNGAKSESDMTNVWSDAHRVYLIYNPDSDGSLFNYGIDKDYYKDKLTYTDDRIDALNRRLSTEVGWSYYEIYQNYVYGSDMAGNSVYTDYFNDGAGGYLEIANLFSRSTYIRVADSKVADLEISKTVSGESASTQEFTFNVGLYSAYTDSENNSPLTDEYTFTVYDVGEDGSRTPAMDKDGKAITGTIIGSAKIPLKNGQVAVIEDVNVDDAVYYTVTETAVEGYTTQYSINGNAVVTGPATGGQTLSWSSNGTNVTTVAYTNTYHPPVALTILKQETGTNIPLPNAEFVLYYTTDDGTNYYYYKGGDWKPLDTGETEATYKLTTDESGEIEIPVLPVGEYQLKEIKAPDGYNLLTSEITLTVTDTSMTSSESNWLSGEKRVYTQTVYNSVGIALPNTGGPGTWLYTTAGLLLMCGAACLLYRSKSCGKEDERGTP